MHGFFSTRVFGFLYDPSSGTFLPDTRHGAKLGDDALRALRRAGAADLQGRAARSGRRVALDRDLDGDR